MSDPKLIKRDIVSFEGNEFKIYPISDTHIGALETDELRLKKLVKEIEDENGWWIGVGDYCNFIGLSDPRFLSMELAEWIQIQHLNDLAKAQRDRFLDIINPIAHKCLALVEGNHERSVKKYYERDIYLDIVNKVKEAGNFAADYHLGVGYSGFLYLRFLRPDGKTKDTYTIFLHHGFGGGKLAGGKALNLQRVLWTNECDIAIMGHTHEAKIQPEAVKTVRGNNIVIIPRLCIKCGTFMVEADYAERVGALPLATAQVELILRPGTKQKMKRMTAKLSL